MTKQSMSALVYQLEASGYLKRKSDPSDARAVLFILTAKGEALKKKAQQVNYLFEKKWLDVLGAKRYKEFRHMLEALTINRNHSS
jgi:DNA-binding MarR family transcriptional regulator